MLTNHLRKTILTGAFAAVPLVGTIVFVAYIEQATRQPLAQLGLNIPGLGLVIALVGVYVLGLFVSSLLGQFFIRLVDRLLQRIPMLRDAYTAWKHISFNDGPGVFDTVVSIEDAASCFRRIGFWSGRTLPNDPEWCCVFVPNAPNPVSGSVMLVKRSQITPLDISSEDAFKMMISTGNFVPPMAASSAQVDAPADALTTRKPDAPRA